MKEHKAINKICPFTQTISQSIGSPAYGPFSHNIPPSMTILPGYCKGSRCMAWVKHLTFSGEEEGDCNLITNCSIWTLENI